MLTTEIEKGQTLRLPDGRTCRIEDIMTNGWVLVRYGDSHIQNYEHVASLVRAGCEVATQADRAEAGKAVL